MRLGLLGGTFDPIHVGHLILAECAREQFSLDEVRFLVAGDPWRKWETQVSPATHRLAMARLGAAANPAFVVDASEVQRPGPTYTIDTLREFRKRLAEGDEIYFLLGEDAVADMPLWREPAAIAELARLAVAPRAGDLNSAMAAAEPAQPGFPCLMIDMPPIGISSTDLRARVRAGQSIRYLVPESVEAYIRKNRLYRT
jgi:nicotinate-nucleotide adenylyltransferase